MELCIALFQTKPPKSIPPTPPSKQLTEYWYWEHHLWEKNINFDTMLDDMQFQSLPTSEMKIFTLF
jgi:hypothetical protein